MQELCIKEGKVGSVGTAIAHNIVSEHAKILRYELLIGRECNNNIVDRPINVEYNTNTV